MKNGGNLTFDFCRDEGLAFINIVKESKRGLFLVILANTEIAKIPQISAAGKYPELTDFTPAADAELLLYGSCKCIEGVPVTPEGIPTPAIITRSALKLYNEPIFIVSGGLNVKPHVPFFDLGGQPGRDFRQRPAVERVRETFERGEILGRELSKIFDYLLIAESIPGGTTTALAVLLSMGVEALGKVSSSLKENPMDLKSKVVKEGMKRARVNFGDLSNDPLEAIHHFGDPMMAAALGLLIGAPPETSILLAGGTQMAAVVRALKSMNIDRLENLAIGTTKWIMQDRSSDLKGLMKQIGSIPIITSNIDFKNSKIDGLKAYESGLVKEGVGAGGAVINTIVRSEGKISVKEISTEVENEYLRLIKK